MPFTITPLVCLTKSLLTSPPRFSQLCLLVFIPFFFFIWASVYLVLSFHVLSNSFLLIFLNVFLSFFSCWTDTRMIDSPEVLTSPSCLPNTERSRPLSRTIENTGDGQAHTNKCTLPPKALAGECLHNNIKVSFFPVVSMFLLFSSSC